MSKTYSVNTQENHLCCLIDGDFNDLIDYDTNEPSFKLTRDGFDLGQCAKERQVFVNIKQRCLNNKNPNYKYYGARGIKVCDRWLKGGFDVFIKDMGICPDGYSIERIDNDGDYTPENCKWISKKNQVYNTRRKVRRLYLVKKADNKPFYCTP